MQCRGAAVGASAREIFTDTPVSTLGCGRADAIMACWDVLCQLFYEFVANLVICVAIQIWAVHGRWAGCAQVCAFLYKTDIYRIHITHYTTFYAADFMLYT